jgi:UDP-N-acetyl-2-amino-2-deoxyglucuronate dehydrogenase
MKKFAIIGVSGFVSERHLHAIKQTKCNLIIAYDIKKNDTILKKYFPKCILTNNLKYFKKYLYRNNLNYLTICSPNYLHFKHIAIGIKNNLKIICEKPLVIKKNEIDKLEKLNEKKKNLINSILQLRMHPSLINLKKKISITKKKYNVDLLYYTERNDEYFNSWKGNPKKSGGIIMNVGVHFFDMMIWLFGNIKKIKIKKKNKELAEGTLDLDKSFVKWKLHLKNKNSKNLQVKRIININGKEVKFSKTFQSLHVKNYQKIFKSLKSNFYESLKSIKLINQINEI